jgi:tRNA U34 5-carboxymethylaminomethyl modifying GTPase MnmE/TrmE
MAQTLARLRHPRTGELLDRALLLRFPAPASFTGAHSLL